MPVFAQTREKARQITCAFNGKRIGLAILQYVQDNDEKFQQAKYTQGAQGGAGQVYPYVKSTGVYHCPDDLTHPASGGVPVSYAINWDLSIPGGSFANGDAITPAQLNAPANTVLLCETRGSVVSVAEMYFLLLLQY